jgi:hypothetical protein
MAGADAQREIVGSRLAGDTRTSQNGNDGGQPPTIS